MIRISIVGTVGVPALYGGFETLAENLVRFHNENRLADELTVYCSARSYPSRPKSFLGARLRYIGLNANGIASIPYDIVSLLSAMWRRSDVILLLGVSGAIALPVVRLSRALIVTNIDGLEWQRGKWGGLARWVLRFSEFMAVRFSHKVITDNSAIAEYVTRTYGRDCHVIPYGGDHVLQVHAKPFTASSLPERYALALCRIEPENNVAMILKVFAQQTSWPLVFVGNWQTSSYGRDLLATYANVPYLTLLDPIYDLGVLRTLRGGAGLYVHGHSAGGTNPSLVEMMHFGVPIMAFDCIYNRYTTEDAALFFASPDALAHMLATFTDRQGKQVARAMRRIARHRYTWAEIGRAYFDLLDSQGV